MIGHAAASPEMRLLLTCARRDLDSSQAEALASCAAAGVNWQKVIVMAGRHKMVPLLWRHLEAHDIQLPAADAAVLRQLVANNARRMLQLSGALLDLTRLFGGSGVRVVPYKGPALGIHLYGDLALRQAGDLDLLVRREDVTRSRKLLFGVGYRAEHALRPGAEEFMVRSRYSETFIGSDLPKVELHWAFTNRDIALSLDLNSLSSNLVSMPVGGGTVQMFGSEDLLMILCVHGSKHQWDRLEWLCGVGEHLRQHSDGIDWTRLLDRATDLGIRRMLLLGAYLAHELLDAPVPATMLDLARADQKLVRLAAIVPTFLTAVSNGAEHPDTSIATDLFRIRLRDGALDQLRFFWYRVTTPSRPESWEAVRIAGIWVPVHALVRPFRLVRKVPMAIRRYIGARSTL